MTNSFADTLRPANVFSRLRSNFRFTKTSTKASSLKLSVQASTYASAEVTKTRHPDPDTEDPDSLYYHLTRSRGYLHIEHDDEAVLLSVQGTIFEIRRSLLRSSHSPLFIKANLNDFKPCSLPGSSRDFRALLRALQASVADILNLSVPDPTLPFGLLISIANAGSRYSFTKHTHWALRSLYLRATTTFVTKPRQRILQPLSVNEHIRILNAYVVVHMHDIYGHASALREHCLETLVTKAVTMPNMAFSDVYFRVAKKHRSRRLQAVLMYWTCVATVKRQYSLNKQHGYEKIEESHGPTRLFLLDAWDSVFHHAPSDAWIQATRYVNLTTNRADVDVLGRLDEVQQVLGEIVAGNFENENEKDEIGVSDALDALESVHDVMMQLVDSLEEFLCDDGLLQW